MRAHACGPSRMYRPEEAQAKEKLNHVCRRDAMIAKGVQ